jgi:phage terminase large subunit-like protein
LPPSAPHTALPKGKTQARLFTESLRPLNRKTSHGYSVAEFADMIGEPLQPWERWTAIHALELMPDGSYRFRVVLVLVARQNGKSHLIRCIVLWRMFMEQRLRVLGVAQDVSLAREQWNLGQEMIHDCPDLEAEWGKARNVNGDEQFAIANGSRWKISAANRKAGRGGSNDLVVIDELREQRSWDAWAALSKTTLARPNSMIFAMSNQGDDEAVVLHQLRGAALAGTDPSLGIFEYSAPDGCELDDWTAIAQANPALGHRVSHAGIRSALTTDPAGVFRTEVLCQHVDQLDGAIDLGAWKACADPSGSMAGLKGRVAAAFDIAPDGDHATLVAAGRLDDGRIRLEVVRSWKSTDLARAELPDLLAKLRPVAFAFYPVGPGAAFAPLLRTQKNPTALNGVQVSEACQGMADLVTARRIVHPDDPLLTAHVAGAQKLPSGDGWRFTRRGGAGHVDAAYAAAGAVWAVEVMPVQRKGIIRVLSA